MIDQFLSDLNGKQNKMANVPLGIVKVSTKYVLRSWNYNQMRDNTESKDILHRKIVLSTMLSPRVKDQTAQISSSSRAEAWQQMSTSNKYMKVINSQRYGTQLISKTLPTTWVEDIYDDHGWSGKEA